MIKYILIYLVLSISLYAQSYTTNSLMWQDSEIVASQEYDMEEAKAYCTQLNLDGYSDWRIPSLEELFTLLDITKRGAAVVDGIEVCASDYYWSDTIFASDNYSYWSIDFTTGIIKVFSPGTSMYVRCVR